MGVFLPLGPVFFRHLGQVKAGHFIEQVQLDFHAEPLMEPPVHGKVGVREQIIGAFFREFFEKTDVIVYGEAKFHHQTPTFRPSRV